MFGINFPLALSKEGAGGIRLSESAAERISMTKISLQHRITSVQGTGDFTDVGRYAILKYIFHTAEWNSHGYYAEKIGEAYAVAQQRMWI